MYSTPEEKEILVGSQREAVKLAIENGSIVEVDGNTGEVTVF